MELTERQREHLDAALVWADLSSKTLLDVLLVAMMDPNEKTEEWALNGLRAFGEIKRKYKDNPQIIEQQKRTIDFLRKVIEFYFQNNPE